MNILTLDDIQRKAPSVFAERPWDNMSENYRFIPTSQVVKGLMDNGFMPVSAKQGNSRIEGKREFTKHLLRFRHEKLTALTKGDEIPEIVLINSHDGTSAYKLMLGIFRVVCANGLVVASSMLDEVKVRHSGKADLVDNVIEGSYQVINQAPVITEQVEQFKNLMLTHDEQVSYATAALELNPSTIDIQPKNLLQPRRYDDRGDSYNVRSLWKTYNTVQENYTKGGLLGLTEQGKLRRTRQIKAISADTKLNKALWVLTERAADFKTDSLNGIAA